MLWNRNFSLLILANVLLFMGVFMLFPLQEKVLGAHEWCSFLSAAVIMMAFPVGMFVLGAFNNYLVDTFSRKHVCTRSILLLAVAGMLYPHAPNLWACIGLWALQGMFFGVALMATGSTLAIDVTPSHKRNEANRIFSWAGLLGIFGGFLLECYSSNFFSVEQQIYFSSALCVAAAVLISMVSVNFRAPLDLPLCSFDRFILFRTLLPGVNMLLGSFALGLMLTSMSMAEFAGVVLGFAGYWVVRASLQKPMNGRLQILVGQMVALLGIGLYLLIGKQHVIGSGVAAFFVGLGTVCSLGQFLHVMILLPMHCERGTGFQTFQLLWNLGFIGGLSVSFACKYHLVSWQTVYVAAALLSGVALLLYQGYVHRYFKKHYQQH